jgi:hypothetical protein
VLAITGSFLDVEAKVRGRLAGRIREIASQSRKTTGQA